MWYVKFSGPKHTLTMYKILLLLILYFFRPVSQSVGVLEMGGGSTQIAFIPDTPIYANMFPVRIGGQRYHLYAHSYLFYGQNYIISRINKYLIQNNVESSQLENPCMLIGGKFLCSFHYENTPIQIYTENFTIKNWNFLDKKSNIFHISAQNIDCGYSLEPPRRGSSNEYPQSMFLSRNKKNNVYPCKPQFYYIKVGFKGVKII